MKIFEFNGNRQGTLIDSVSKTAGTLTAGNGGFRRTGKGYALLCDGADTALNIGVKDNTGNKTFICWIKPKSLGEINAGHIYSDLDYNNIFLASNKLKVSRNGSTTAESSDIDLNKWLCVIVTSTDAGITNIYIDNSLSGAANQSAGAPQLSSTATYIGNRSGSDRTFDGYIAKVTIHNEILSTEQRNELYKEFLRATPIEKPTRNFVYPKPTDLSGLSYQENEIAAVLLTNKIRTDQGWEFDTDDVTITSTIFSLMTSNVSEARVYYNNLVVGTSYSLTISSILYSGSASIVNDSTGYSPVILSFSGTQTQSTTFVATSESLTIVITGIGTILRFVTSELSNSAYTEIIPGLVAAYSFSPETVSNGTLVDVSGNGNNGTINGALLTKDGMKFDGVDDYVDMGAKELNEGTIAFKFNQILSTNAMILGLSSSDFIAIPLSSPTLIKIRIDSIILNFTIDEYIENEDATIVITITNTGTDREVRLYFNGVESSSGALLTGETEPYQYRYIAYGGFVGSYLKGEMKDLKIYNYAFTPAQVVNYHNSFNHPVLIEHYNNYPVGPIANSGTGVFEIEEKVIEQGELQTGSGTFETDETSNWPSVTGGTFTYDSENKYGVFTNTDGDVNNRIYQEMDLSSNKRYKFKAQIKSPNVSGRGIWKLASTAGSMVDVLSTNLNPNLTTEFQWYEFEFIGALNEAVVFYRSTYMTGGQIGDIYHIKNIKVTEIPPLPSITTGSKLLKCTTAGTIATPSTQAYGEWEFNFNKTADANVWAIFFILNTKSALTGSGYYCVADNYNSIYLKLRNSGSSGAVILRTDGDYININTYYRIKIARLKSAGTFASIVPTMTTTYAANTFAVFIKGGIFVDEEGKPKWTLVDTTGGVGTNPVTNSTYTTSNYIVADLDVNDSISGIELYNEVEQ